MFRIIAMKMKRKARSLSLCASINGKRSGTKVKTKIISDQGIINRCLDMLLSKKDSLTPISKDDFDEITARRPYVRMITAENIKSIKELTELIQNRILIISGRKPCSVMIELSSHPSFIHLDDFPTIVDAIEAGGAQAYKNSIEFSRDETEASLNMFVFYGD